jgi:tetratricopeptide (TPR) repeat protein
MNRILLILNLLLSFAVFGQDSKLISGFVTNMNAPLKDANVLLKNTNTGTKTNSKGYYSVEAKKGDILTFTYVGMKTINILVEDVTKILNVDLFASDNMLDEVTITGKKNIHFGSKSKIDKFTTTRNSIDLKRAGYGVSYIDGEDLNPAAFSLGKALQGKVAGYQLSTDRSGNELVFLRGKAYPAIWDIDGITFESAPPINIDDVKDIAVIKSLAGTGTYGSQAIGGVIVVRTKSSHFQNTKDIYSESNPYTNKEYYKNDALSFKTIRNGRPLHLQLFDTISNAQEAYNKYIEVRSSYENRPNFHFDLANYFLKSHNDFQSFQAVLKDLEYYAPKNAEALKVLAYKYQKNNLHQKALAIYKKIMLLRPSYAQSFRDLANAYVHLKEYRRAWKLYKYYLQKGNTLDENAIGEIIYREMEALYILKGKEANITDVFKRKENSSDTISTAIRMVFEWNTSEAEFALEFVNPQKKSYTIEHSLAESSELIFDEKQKGYSSKEFIIDKIKTTDKWLVNINYLGNKKYVPTYLKVTVYYNWGTDNQTEEINLFKLTVKNLKTQLLKLDARHITIH